MELKADSVKVLTNELKWLNKEKITITANRALNAYIKNYIKQYIEKNKPKGVDTLNISIWGDNVGLGGGFDGNIDVDAGGILSSGSFSHCGSYRYINGIFTMHYGLSEIRGIAGLKYQKYITKFLSHLSKKLSDVAMYLLPSESFDCKELISKVYETKSFESHHWDNAFDRMNTAWRIRLAMNGLFGENYIDSKYLVCFDILLNDPNSPLTVALKQAMPKTFKKLLSSNMTSDEYTSLCTMQDIILGCDRPLCINYELFKNR